MLIRFGKSFIKNFQVLVLKAIIFKQLFKLIVCLLFVHITKKN